MRSGEQHLTTREKVQDKVKAKRVLLLAAALVTATVRAGFTVVDSTTLEGLKTTADSTITLEDGVVYTFTSETLAKTNGVATVNPMPVLEVAAGAIAVLEIPAGHTLSLKGSDGNGDIPGAAAIRVPESSSLIVTGEGTLIAAGGRAGDGGSGKKGSKGARVDGDKGACGYGGAGGAGGGGAGAAIGGNGGVGGTGGAEVTTSMVDVMRDGSMRDQSNTKLGYLAGNSGGQGGVGEPCGGIWILGRVRVVAADGSDGVGGGTEDYTGTNKNNGSWNFDDVFFGGGGPGGGGGGGGRADFVIGHGGGGGGGGGSGSSGSMVLVADKDDYSTDYEKKILYVYGHPGEPGLGRTGMGNGTKSTAEKNHLFQRRADDDPHYDEQPSSQDAAPAGQGGNFAAVQTPDWRLVQSTTASVEGSRLPSFVIMNTHASVSYSVRLVNSSVQTEVRSVALYADWPELLVPIRDGFVFNGYWTQRNGTGTCVVDGDGHRLVGGVYWTDHEDLTLYASWRFDDETENVVVEEGETRVVDEYVGGSELRQPFAGHLFEVRRGGTLILLNKTVQGVDGAANGAILNAGTVLASNCVFVGCCTVEGAGGVYADRPGAFARFERCTFRDNSAHEGACLLAEGSTVSLEFCTFLDNYTFATDTSGGSAVCALDGAWLNIVSCTCASNADVSVETAVRPFRFGAISSSSVLLNSILYDEGMPDGGGPDEWDEGDGRNVPLDYCCLFGSAAREALGPYVTSVRAGGVCQASFRIVGRGRQDGCATEVWRSGDGRQYGHSAALPDGAVRLSEDQFGQLAVTGYIGARCGNTLQRLINEAPAGSELAVPVGDYDPVVVGKSLRVTTADGGFARIDGCGYEPCVTFRDGAEETLWSSFSFVGGLGEDGGGVTWTGTTANGGAVSNCLFVGNAAVNGGGAARLATVEACVFSNNVATAQGGGTYGVGAVVRSLYYGNRASNGGGSAGDVVQTSLFRRNGAQDSGGGIFGSMAYNCTFAENTSLSNGTVAAGLYRLYASLLYPKTSTVTDSSVVFSTFAVDSTPFSDAANGDFHLALTKLKPYSASDYEKVDQSAYRVTDDSSCANARKGWLDMDGIPILSLRTLLDPETGDPIASDEYLYAGCYAYMPFKRNGLLVTGTDDYYRNSISECSLREAVEEAASDPFYCRNGEYVVTFSPKMFTDGIAVIPSSTFQIVVDGFTNGTLVIRGPQNGRLCFDGGLEHRSFSVRAGSSLRIENVTFRNFFGEPVGGAGTDGGAIVNAGRLVVTNCVFAGCRAGNGAWNPDRPIGYGGAVATMAHGETTLYGVTFRDNLAARGGALYVAAGGTNRVFFSTFTGNVADGSASSGNPAGGAVASGADGWVQVEPDRRVKIGPVLWLVNCTVTGNTVADVMSAGGGVYAQNGLLALNSLIVGNSSGSATNDIELASGGSATFCCTVLGERTSTNGTASASRKIVYEDTSVLTAVDVRDVLSAPVEIPCADSNVWHTVVPLSESAVDLPATNVWVTPGFADLGVGTAKGCTKPMAGAKPSSLVRNGVRLCIDQTGVGDASALAGATLAVGTSLWEREADPGDEPSEKGEDEVPEDEAVIVLVTPTGETRYYATAETARRHYQAGDSVRVKDSSDEAAKDALIEVFYFETVAFAEECPWFDVDWDTDGWTGFTSGLNTLAVPRIDSIEVDAAAQEVQVTLAETRPLLWYSLATGDEGPSGRFVCKEWVQADAEGQISSPLTAATSALDDRRFYKVYVLPHKP